MHGIIQHDLTTASRKLQMALLGDGHPVDWWGLPTRLEWAQIPDRGFLGYQTGSLTLCVAFGRPQRSWVQELKPSSPARFLLVVEAGGRSPGRSLGFDHPKANRCMTNSCRDTEAPPFLGVSTPYLLYGHKMCSLHLLSSPRLVSINAWHSVSCVVTQKV